MIIPSKFHSRYKTHEESRAERRNYFTEREIPIQAPLAPPRNKKKEFARRQSIKDFRDENRQTLFKSDHQTDEGVDLLPVNKKIAFDCPDNGARAEEIHVDIIGMINIFQEMFRIVGKLVAYFRLILW